MGAGRRKQTFTPPSSPNKAPSAENNRNLGKNDLGSVIFGCKKSTIKECLSKQLFGLRAHHFSYIKNIDPGMPLFLFNYSDRKLHGIFEAASSGQMNIDPYAWTSDGSKKTLYPAQVQIRVRLPCHPLPEEQFKPIIIDNYYRHNHLWFELDHVQTSKLICMLSTLAVAPITSSPQNTTKQKTLFQAPPSNNRGEEIEVFKPPALEVDFPHSYKSNGMGSSDVAVHLGRNCHPLEGHLRNQVMEKEKDLTYMKLKQLALNREQSDLPLTGVENTTAVNDVHSVKKGLLEAQTNSEEMNEENPVKSFDYNSVIAQWIQGMEEQRAFKIEQIHKMGFLEQRLVEAEIEIQQLKRRCMTLEGISQPSLAHDDETVMDSFDDRELDLDELIFFVGGYDGVSCLSALDAYSPTHDVIKSLRPMNSFRSYASVAWFNGEIFVFGGGNGVFWSNTVESYDPANNHWTQCPPLSVEKGCLAGATLNDKIYAMGGGDRELCFADVEMFDLDVGHWISIRSMLQRRFALAAAELNGAIYAVGGFDGNEYLKSAERFDPREHSWNRIEGMNTRRGSHSMAVLNEKLYAIGGYDGSEMVPSVEIFDPRLGFWMTAEPMDQPRGYSAAAISKDCLYVFGGTRTDNSLVDTVECYKEGRGWQVTNLRGIGRRSYHSAVWMNS